MASLTIKVFGFDCTVELDSDGCIRSLLKFPIVLREELVRLVRISRLRAVFVGIIDSVECAGHTVEELLEAYAARVESVDYVARPSEVALEASNVLAVNKGIPNKLQANDYDGYDVVLDNGRRFQFRQK